MSSGIRILALVALGALATGCLQVRWQRVRDGQPIEEASTAELTPGVATLTEVLEVCGAPIEVRELPDNGIACIWAWYGQRTWGLTLEVPLGSGPDANFDYQDSNQSTPGLVAFFDRDLVLVEIQRGTVTQSFFTEDPLPRLVSPDELSALEAQGSEAEGR